MNNYANNVFEAIDTIINQRLSELSFDRTITCKIVEEVKDKPNTYWVSNDSMRFQAIAQDGKKYSKKEEVFVLIPNGEYSNEKIITGSRIDDSKNGYNKMKYISIDAIGSNCYSEEVFGWTHQFSHTICTHIYLKRRSKEKIIK